MTLFDTAADLSATAADIAANITEALPCPDLIGHARQLLDALADGLGDATDHPIPYTLTPKAHAALGPALAGDGEDTALEDAAQAAWEAECDATWWETVTAMSAARLLDGQQHPDGTSSEWSCKTCGDGYFGTYPDDELCPRCRSAA